MKHLDPSPASFMINYRVDDKVDVPKFGKFGWVMDPEHNRIELCEPPRGRFPG